MDCDDLVIGAGLAGLGTVLGLMTEPGRRVRVLCGPAEGSFLHYDAQAQAPCAYLGAGGLGQHWHGVLPTGLSPRLGDYGDADFIKLFRHFYPHAEIAARLGTTALFVPWRPIRPRRELQRLSATHAGLRLVYESAQQIRLDERGVRVTSAAGQTLRAARCWLTAGALHTPKLLARSFGATMIRGLASDHVLCYLGQVDDHVEPHVKFSRDGIFFPSTRDAAGRALYTLRPARFDFQVLDAGFERRQVFGLPTGSLLTKLARRVSPGLLVEAAYNRLGCFGGGRRHSVYAQLPVVDAYALQAGSLPLQARARQIRAASDAVRAAQPFVGLRASRRPEFFLPGIHLHHTLNLEALKAEGLNVEGARLQVLDASAFTDIGAEHHSFKMLVSAYARASRTVGAWHE